MAKMRLGYGSEYQLLRFLGRHREELNKLVLDAIGLSGLCEQLEWLDFPYIKSKGMNGDEEWKGIDCFESLSNYPDIKEKWIKFWPQCGNSMNWDAIFKIKDTWFFIEAKAYKDEVFQSCNAKSENSKNVITRAFEDTQLWLGAKELKKWIDSKSYQLANRLAFLYFCKKCGLKAKLVYIGFLNGFKKRRENDEIHSIQEWEGIWKEELNSLGLDREQINSHIFFVYPNCEK